jgi:hypothetical protein
MGIDLSWLNTPDGDPAWDKQTPPRKPRKHLPYWKFTNSKLTIGIKTDMRMKI